jgi:hypothetical protein
LAAVTGCSLALWFYFYGWVVFGIAQIANVTVAGFLWLYPILTSRSKWEWPNTTITSVMFSFFLLAMLVLTPSEYLQANLIGMSTLTLMLVTGATINVLAWKGYLEVCIGEGTSKAKRGLLEEKPKNQPSGKTTWFSIEIKVTIPSKEDDQDS